MFRLPPRSTRTDTLLPYTTLCLSRQGVVVLHEVRRDARRGVGLAVVGLREEAAVVAVLHRRDQADLRYGEAGYMHAQAPPALARSEERRVGKACVRTCRSRCSPHH